MARALRFTKEQLNELIVLARARPTLWADLKHREDELEAHYQATRSADPPEHQTQPSMAMLVHSLIDEVYGPAWRWDTGSIIIAIRRELRRELGYPNY